MLHFMGAPMVHGAISTLIAVAFIFGSRTPFLVKYYAGLFCAMIVISFLNGMVLLPVILSFIGPAPCVAEGSKEDPGRKGSTVVPLDSLPT